MIYYLVCPLLLKTLYADDTCVLVSSNDLKAPIKMLNDEFISLNNWFNSIRSGIFQTANDPGGWGFKPPPLRSRKLLCQSSLYHTCVLYQVFRHVPIGIF